MRFQGLRPYAYGLRVSIDAEEKIVDRFAWDKICGSVRKVGSKIYFPRQFRDNNRAFALLAAMKVIIPPRPGYSIRSESITSPRMTVCAIGLFMFATSAQKLVRKSRASS
jgi:hypothetical protein